MYDCAQSSITSNNLNLPTYDIHAKESREQILYNFHKLSETFINISTKHLEKSQQQNEKISRLRERILKCKERIGQFEGSNQALIFISPSEYPKKYKFDPESNVSIFNDYLIKTRINKLDMNSQYQVKHEIQKLGQESKLKLTELNNFVIFLLAHLQGKKKSVIERSLHPSKRKQQTIGNIPHTVQYLDSLLIFNSCINPYRKYEITNNLIEIVDNRQNNKSKEMEEIANNQILIDRELVNYTKPEYEADSRKFIPQEKELDMPEFDFDLDLEGIVNYNENSENTFMEQFGVSTTGDWENNVKRKNVVVDTFAATASNNNTSPNKETQSNISTSTSYSSTLPPPPTMLNNKTQSSPPTNNLPPPPPGLPTNLPPPPPFTGNLPPPPPLTGKLPPPPTLPGTLPPAPSLPGTLPPAPKMPGMASKPTASKGGNDISALLAEIENPNPLARLRKTVTVEKGGIKQPKPKKEKPVQSGSNTEQQSNPSTSENPQEELAPIPEEKPRELSFMEALQAKIKSRFQALHPEQDSEED